MKRRGKKKEGEVDEKSGEKLGKRGEERRGELGGEVGLRPVEVAGLLHFGTADLQSDTLRAPSTAISQDSVDGS